MNINDLYEKIQARVPKVAGALMEKYRVAALARAPEYARFIFEGPGWETKLKDKEFRREFEDTAWRIAFCEIIQVLMEGDEELECRIAALENKNQ